MNKKGFTLIELLAVIAILAILIVFALPKILQLFEASKRNVFLREVQVVYKTAQENITLNKIKNIPVTNFNSETNKLNLNSKKLQYVVGVNSNIINTICVNNDSYIFDSTNINQ